MSRRPTTPLRLAACLLTATLVFASCSKKGDATGNPATVSSSQPGASNPVAAGDAPAAPFVRAGPLASARRLGDHLATLRPGETSVKLTLNTGEAWTIRVPVDDVDLPEIPQYARTPWIHVKLKSEDVLVPFAIVGTARFTPVGGEKENALARLVLQDGTEISGTVKGHLGGATDFGRLEAPWAAIREIEVVSREGSGPADALPVAAGGTAELDDGTRMEFVSFAAVVGDVAAGAVLAEAGTGPEFLPLESIATLHVEGSDTNAFFFQHVVSLTGRDRSDPVRRNIALTCLLAQQPNGCIRAIQPGRLRTVSLR